MQKSIHAGHRERLRNKFINLGHEALEEHELLELLLFYAIPQKNTNPIAHALINRFGSIKGVMEAEIRELCEVNGISEYSASLIKLQAALAKVYYTTVPKKLRLATVGQAAEYVINQLYGRKTEAFYAFALDINLGLLGYRMIAEGEIDSVSVSIRKLAAYALDTQAAYLLLAHNHPNGSARPSREDIDLTGYIVSGLQPLGIGVCDHIITAGKDFYSFNQKKIFTSERSRDELLAAQYTNLGKPKD
ncbi:MAG: RadC family protein [Christensenellaceae bacterium]|nr:RadC family protein [Christensenellaceae bacterium]